MTTSPPHRTSFPWIPLLFFAIFGIVVGAIFLANTREPAPSNDLLSHTSKPFQKLVSRYQTLKSFQADVHISIETQEGGQTQRQSAFFQVAYRKTKTPLQNFYEEARVRTQDNEQTFISAYDGQRFVKLVLPVLQYIEIDSPEGNENLQDELSRQSGLTEVSLLLIFGRLEKLFQDKPYGTTIEKDSHWSTRTPHPRVEQILASISNELGAWHLTLTVSGKTGLLTDWEASQSGTDSQSGQAYTSTVKAHYQDLRYDRAIPDSVFMIKIPPEAQRVKEFDEAHYEQRLEELMKAYQDKPAPNIPLETLEGHKTSLTDFRGNVVLLDFWATWCTICAFEIPTLNELYREFHSKGVDIVGVTREKKDAVRQFLRGTPVHYPLLFPTQGVPAPYLYQTQYPTAFLIDRQGIIRAIYEGYKDEKKLKSALTQWTQASPAAKKSGK